VHNAMPSGPLASAVSRMLGDTTGTLGLERYGETLTPTLNPWSLIEWAYLRHEKFCIGWAGTGPVAGENSVVCFLNPSDSRRIMVVARAHAIVSANGYVMTAFPIDQTAVVGADVSTLNTVDSRWGAVNYPTGRILAGTTAAPPAGRALIHSDFVGNSSNTPLAQEIVLDPGTAVLYFAAAVNVSIRVSISWRERQALVGELE
jgi:hypothetical protein